MQENREWISISDMMAGLMMVFLFIAILFMSKIQQQQKDIENKQKAIEYILEKYKNKQDELNKDLNKEFKNDLKKWDAEILKDNTIRFNAPKVQFDTGKADLKYEFTEILENFFPRYLKILIGPKYKEEIKELRIEGHTSSIWYNASKEKKYLKNMQLSQDRASAVLEFVYSLKSSSNSRRWLECVIRANGMSFANLIKKNGVEDTARSQRVEFKVLTKSEEKINEIIKKNNMLSKPCEY